MIYEQGNMDKNRPLGVPLLRLSGQERAAFSSPLEGKEQPLSL